MDVLRRNTDYALRAIVKVAGWRNAAPVSTKDLADSENIPYQLACKLMQRLHKAGLVESILGPEGGFVLKKPPVQISMLEVIHAIQGPVVLNRCLVGKNGCPLRKGCAVNPQLAGLQEFVDGFLRDVTLDKLVSGARRTARFNGRRKK